MVGKSNTRRMKKNQWEGGGMCNFVINKIINKIRLSIS